MGCHEDQNQIVIPKRVIASQKAPHALTPPEGGTRSFTFDLEVQPILDRACIACHNGEGKAFDLRGGKKDGKGYEHPISIFILMCIVRAVREIWWYFILMNIILIPVSWSVF